MGIVKTGMKRRIRLLNEALRPPRSDQGRATVPPQRTPEPKSRPRPEKRVVEVEYTVSAAPRLVESPVFVLAPVRSGSTLLRMLLNSHSRVRAPHELHLRTVDVQTTPGFSEKAMRVIDLDAVELEHLLWDRVLHLELERHGKDVIVDKTPGNVWMVDRLRHAWPQARFIVLLRHPEGIVSSLANRKGNTATRAELERNVLKYCEPLEKARTELDCLTVRYEDLTEEPETVTRALCDYLGVEWEPGMLEYGDQEHGPFAANLGDRSEKIKSGRIQAARTLTGEEELSPQLAKFAAAWGYTPDG